VSPLFTSDEDNAARQPELEAPPHGSSCPDLSLPEQVRQLGNVGGAPTTRDEAGQLRQAASAFAEMSDRIDGSKHSEQQISPADIS
jgi:hypothetical protein